MTTCPVCEHPQEWGDECDNCGMRLAQPTADAAPVAVLPELMLTQLDGGRAPVPVQALPDLEFTRTRAVQVAVAPVAELEPTRQADAEVAVQALSELDTGRAPDDGARTALPEALVCRYCRNVQATGLFCERCGMRLPKVRTEAAGAGVVVPAASKEAGWVRCSRCHTPARAGRTCATCGTLNHSET